MKQEATEYYHSLLTDQIAAESYAQMESMMRDRKLFFGDRPLCTVLRPHFYGEEQFQYLKTETELILQAFAKSHRAIIADPKIRASFHLEPWEEEALHFDYGKQIPWSTSRLDSFYDLERDTLSFIEYNAETPAGMGYEDVLGQMFLDLPLIKRFQEKYSIRPLPVRHRLVDALLQTYEQWLGHKPSEPPQIAIVDWEEVPTRNEHRILQSYFESHGIRTTLADPRNMQYSGGKLWAGDFHVDLYYKRVLAGELVQKMGIDNALFRALQDRAVCVSNSFQALVLYKKCSLAFLSDEANQHLFTAKETEAIHRHVPWTRIVENRRTYYNNSTVDLVDFITDYRERLVLKPNDAYGGKGVVLGWETTPEEWQEAVQIALQSPFVVQEKVNVASESFPSFAENRLRFNKLYVDADPFIFMGVSVGGCLTRLSSASLLNVTAGAGSAIPTFILGKK
jgi:glutathionylspermidine synthase